MEIPFQTIGWEKYCLLKTPLKILVWLWNTEMSVLKWRNKDMEMFMKNAQCVLVLTSTSQQPVRPHLPTYGKGLSHIVCSY